MVTRFREALAEAHASVLMSSGQAVPHIYSLRACARACVCVCVCGVCVCVCARAARARARVCVCSAV